jgi:PAT family beta-lactamase induction signal transducer AmpG
VPAGAPRSLRESVWLPFVGFLSRNRALEILAFVILYKLADNLSQSLLLPFLNRMGYGPADRGLGYTVVSLTATLGGTFLGGAATTVLGLGRCLWIFGVLQIVSNVGFILIASSEPDRLLMYSAMGFEALTTGTGMGAFGVFLLHITERRFSATQYALFSSLFAMPRILAGPITGWLVHTLGWVPFFWITMGAGIPGLVMLSRFVAPWEREPKAEHELPARAPRPPVGQRGLVLRGLGWGLGGFAGAILLAAGLDALDAATKNQPLTYADALVAALSPHGFAGWSLLVGCAVAGAIIGVFAAAVAAARSGPPQTS